MQYTISTHRIGNGTILFVTLRGPIRLSHLIGVTNTAIHASADPDIKGIIFDETEASVCLEHADRPGLSRRCAESFRPGLYLAIVSPSDYDGALRSAALMRHAGIKAFVTLTVAESIAQIERSEPASITRQTYLDRINRLVSFLPSEHLRFLAEGLQAAVARVVPPPQMQRLSLPDDDTTPFE